MVVVVVVVVAALRAGDRMRVSLTITSRKAATRGLVERGVREREGEMREEMREERYRLIMELNARIPGGPLERKWDRHRFEMKLVNPANKRKYTIIVVGSGLGGGAAAATLGELGYNVKCFCFQDSPRRAHSIAAALRGAGADVLRGVGGLGGVGVGSV